MKISERKTLNDHQMSSLLRKKELLSHIAKNFLEEVRNFNPMETSMNNT